MCNKTFAAGVDIPGYLHGGGINFLKNYGQIFPWATDTSYQGYQCLFITPVIFILLLRIEKIRFGRVIEKVAKVSLEIYLISYIFDRTLYHFINATSMTFAEKLLLDPVTIGLTFLASVGAAIPINMIVQKVFVLVKRRILCIIS